MPFFSKKIDSDAELISIVFFMIFWVIGVEGIVVLQHSLIGSGFPIHENRPNIPVRVSIHQLHQLRLPEMPIRLQRLESAFSAVEGFKFSGGIELLCILRLAAIRPS
jgi:hypothetical protein